MKEHLKYLGFTAFATLIIWGFIYLFAITVKDYEVIEIEEGIKCVVVSRMMNTSVSCVKVQS